MHESGSLKEPAMTQAGGQGSSLGMAPSFGMASLPRFDHVVSSNTLTSFLAFN